MDKDKYSFKPYPAMAPLLFAEEKSRILAAVDRPVLIEHVGSTAVPGLGGKGIIDIAIHVEVFQIDHTKAKLQALGYDWREKRSSKDRLFFRVDLPDQEIGFRRYHVHLIPFGSPEWDLFLSFRDYLRTYSDKAEQYAERKKQAAQLAQGDGEKYREWKEPLFHDRETLSSKKAKNVRKS